MVEWTAIWTSGKHTDVNRLWTLFWRLSLQPK